MEGLSIAMILLIISAVVVFVLTVLVLERNIKSRLVFCAFCLSLVTAISILGYTYLVNTSTYTEPDESTIRHITAQQQAFGEWYTIYKKKLENVDYYWVLYHRILTDFKYERISLNEAHQQLSTLETDVVGLHKEIFQMMPPISLDDNNYDLTASMLEKTKSYSDAQLKTIRATKAAADPDKTIFNNHNQQVQALNDARLLNAPDMLFTAREIITLRDNLTIPEVD